MPWGDDGLLPAVVAPPNGGPPVVENTGIPIYKETAYGLVGLAGESRSGDANGQYIRVSAGGGINTVVFPAGGGPAVGSSERSASLRYQLLGYEPAIQSSPKTPFRPDIPCETQDPPNLSSGGVADPPAPNDVRAYEPRRPADRIAQGRSRRARTSEPDRAVRQARTPQRRQLPRGRP